MLAALFGLASAELVADLHPALLGESRGGNFSAVAAHPFDCERGAGKRNQSIMRHQETLAYEHFLDERLLVCRSTGEPEAASIKLAMRRRKTSGHARLRDGCTDGPGEALAPLRSANVIARASSSLSDNAAVQVRDERGGGGLAAVDAEQVA